MNRTWNSNNKGHNMIEPMTWVQRLTLGGMALVILGVIVLVEVISPSTDQDREVWWTVACPTSDQPDRVCLDGSVTLDQLPRWAGGSSE